MNIALWILQVLVALAFIMAGYQHAFRQEHAKTQIKWIGDVPSGLATFIGVMEILGAEYSQH
ncbi:MAG: hypothetical protein EXR62_08800 [Chloroflexi bacterium]|nr:hypothetical protein [Chloroflexota bacterium]